MKWTPWLEAAAGAEWEHFIEHHSDPSDRALCSVDSLLEKRTLCEENEEEESELQFHVQEKVSTPMVSDF